MPMLKCSLLLAAVLCCLMSCATARKGVDDGDLWWKHIQPVDKQAAARFNQLMATLTERIANAPQPPRWKQESFFRRFVQ
jgi:hypothetical protein